MSSDVLKNEELRDKIIDALRTVYDPEIPVNIYELGLIYEIGINDDNDVAIDMTLTAPNCPAAGSMPAEVQSKVAGLEGVKSAEVKVVWEPQWTQDMITEAGKLQLGLL